MTQKTLSQLAPSIVWQIFEAIIKVPRCSKKEEKIRAWVRKWAQDHGIKFREDSLGNILLTQTATSSLEDTPTLTLQGHMDIVCEKKMGIPFNFDIDPINAFIDEDDLGKFVTAKDTTLGADNGIGVAMALASLVDSELKHGPLEVLLTVDEETGLTGAFNIKPGFFTGNYLLNLDSEDLGIITISSAGGGETEILLNCQVEPVTEVVGFELVIKGLNGGHSGTDIHRGRLNAIKILFDALSRLKNNHIQIKEIVGGKAHNAIPLYALSKFFVPTHQGESVHQFLKRWAEDIKSKVIHKEPNVSIEFNHVNEATTTAFSKESTLNIIDLGSQLPHGPLTYSKDIPGLVETSNNLAVVSIEDNKVKFLVSTRSAKNDELTKARNGIKSIAERFGAPVILGQLYPGWYSDLNSPFLNLVKQKYELVSGKKVELKAIHAGLECGLFTKLDPDIQIVAFGPDIKDAHSTKERVYIKSVEIIWKLVKEVIKNMGTLNKV